MQFLGSTGSRGLGRGFLWAGTHFSSTLLTCSIRRWALCTNGNSQRNTSFGRSISRQVAYMYVIDRII
ncbi:hypothetical protein LY78DRAFT_424687 [Colletotrichum sublineola]|nr:hypothetical protein LY78DRAFT_424687 [Colletotrichum sublineola]